jgi:hypothetical protein
VSLRRVLLGVLVLALFAASGWTYVRRASTVAPPQQAHAAEWKLARLQLRAAAQALAQLHRLTATYEEADLHVIHRLHLVTATESSYCVQVVEGDGFLFHLAGPGGRVAAGPCPRRY